MPCYYPIFAWRGDVLPSGKREMLFKRPLIESASLFQLKLPCGNCIGCRLERSRQWAMRCMHEASLYSSNCFITLTYSRSNLPSDGSLVLRHFQLFMKRLRKVAGSGVRFLHCGEYGEKYGRPHYHAIIFNYDFPDKVVFRKTERGDITWTSLLLNSLWSYGYSMIGSVSYESAAYVARYCMKKVDCLEKRYVEDGKVYDVVLKTGEIRVPEYITMSRGSKSLGTGGIGRAWYNKYKSDIYPRDYAIVNGMKVRPPKYYDGLYELSDGEAYYAMKMRRMINACKIDPTGIGELGDVRLRVKEVVKRAQIRSLSRNLEV